MGTKKDHVNYAIVFSGGGAFGAWEAGAYTSIIEAQGCSPKVISGASAGALNAGGIYLGLKPEDLERLWIDTKRKQIFRKKRARWIIAGILIGIWTIINVPFYIPILLFSWLPKIYGKQPFQWIPWLLTNWLKKLALYVLGKSIFDNAPLTKTLKEGYFKKHPDKLNGENLKLAIALTKYEASTGKSRKDEKYIAFRSYNPKDYKLVERERDFYYYNYLEIKNKNHLIDMMVASSAIPIAFPDIDGYHDGGIVNNQPLWAAFDLLKNESFVRTEGYVIYVVIPYPRLINPPKNLGQAFNFILEIWLNEGLDVQLEFARIHNDLHQRLLEPLNKTLPEDKRMIMDKRIQIRVIRPRVNLGQKYNMDLLSFGHKNIKSLIQNGKARCKELIAHYNNQSSDVFLLDGKDKS